MKSENLQVEKQNRPKQNKFKKKRRSKTVHLSDLPPLISNDGDIMIEEIFEIANENSKIKIKN